MSGRDFSTVYLPLTLLSFYFIVLRTSLPFHGWLFRLLTVLQNFGFRRKLNDRRAQFVMIPLFPSFLLSQNQ